MEFSSARRRDLQKKAFAPPSRTGRTSPGGERWKAHQASIDPRRLVFIDETWAKTNMTRTHGRCARGERLVAKAPFGRWRTLTFLAALRCDRLTAPCVIDGPINGASFRAYVEQVRSLYEDVYCRRGQPENHIKSFKTHLAADRTSCTKASANQLRLFLHAGAYWLMWGLRESMPKRSMWRVAQLRFVKSSLAWSK
jgi:Transposase DDE domain group 1